MKKLHFILMFLCYYCPANAQFSFSELANPNNETLFEPTDVPNSYGAVIVKTANIDLPNNTNLIGIVWSDINDNGYLYVADFANSNVIPTGGSLAINSSGNIHLDPGYLIGDVDIAMVPRSNNSISNHGAFIKVIYQRRLNNGNPWEVVVKTYSCSNLLMGGITNPIQNGSAFSLGEGKHVSIDAIVQVDKFMPDLLKAMYVHFAIGWGTHHGYPLRIIDLSNNILDSTMIPYSFPLTHHIDDTVRDIDLAAVCNIDFSIAGAVSDDIIYIACANDGLWTMGFDIWKWEIDYSMLTSGPLNLLTTEWWYNFGFRLKIDAMSVQDASRNEPSYNVLIGEDCSSNILHTFYGGGPMHIYLPYNFQADAYDICAGIGYLGDTNFVANRHYNIIRESFDDYLIISGVTRQAPNISYPIGGGIFIVEDLINKPFNNPPVWPSPRIRNNNDTYSCGTYMGYYQPKMIDNIATSSSINSGKCILNAWTDTEPGDPTYKIHFKILESVNDLQTTPPGGATHWRTEAPKSSSNASINIFPNPATTQLTIECNESLIKNIAVMSVDGKVIHMPFNINGNTAILNTVQLAVGTYKVIIATENGATMHTNFVKQ